MPQSRMRWMIVLVLTASLAAASCGSTATPFATPTNAAPATATLTAAAATSAPTATNVAATATVAATAPAATTAAPTPVSTAITLTDSLSRTVTLAGPARQVVSLAPSNTEILYAIGAGAVLAGRDDYSDYPAQATAVPSIGNEIPLNMEAIAALHPDLVLAAGITSPDDVAQLAKLGLTVYATSNAGGLDDIYHDIHAVRVLVGQADAANKLAASMQARVDAVKAKTAAVTQPPVVFYEIDATDPGKP
jgi:iron complex transport system substrate-binding protein